MKYCVIRTETNTLAWKGRKLLGTHGIRTETVRTDSGEGCANGLKLPCDRMEEAKEILMRGGIPVSPDDRR